MSNSQNKCIFFLKIIEFLVHVATLKHAEKTRLLLQEKIFLKISLASRGLIPRGNLMFGERLGYIWENVWQMLGQCLVLHLAFIWQVSGFMFGFMFGFLFVFIYGKMFGVMAISR